MNQTHTGDIVNDVLDFFPPVSSDMIDGLIGQYDAKKRKLTEVSNIMNNEGLFSEIGHYFIEGNKKEDRYISGISVNRLFDIDGAVSQLNAEFWDKALKLTDILGMMPQKRRSEWYGLIQKKETPDFTEDTVRATLMDLINQRPKFFAERVDGTFRALSRHHVTNRPEGFSKRMILFVKDSIGLNHSYNIGHINDLRCVIAKFMDREDPSIDSSYRIIDSAYRSVGEWHSIDAGAMRIKVFKKGTAHLEVHEDMAWRLNGILASLYPNAIPEKFRRPTKETKFKDFTPMIRPLPSSVLKILSNMKQALEKVGYDHFNRIPNTLAFLHTDVDKHAINEAHSVLEMIGGVKILRNEFSSYYQFDYDPTAVVDEIIISGCIPDKKSHQFFPTPERLAKIVIEKAMEGVDDNAKWLEPSAGTGGIADRLLDLNVDLQCIEISNIHSTVLETKGHNVICGDFLNVATIDDKFDRIVMNPPFDQGRWSAHISHAAGLLKQGGRLVSILPKGAQGRDTLPGMECSWYGPFSKEFVGTSIDVVILVANNPN